MLEGAQIDILADDPADLLLLLGDGAPGLNHEEIELLPHALVLHRDFALEHPEAFHGIRAPAHIHARLVVFEYRPGFKDPPERHLQFHPEVEGDVGLAGELIDLLHPGLIHASDGVPGVGRINVPVRQNDEARPEQGQDLALVAVGEICGVDEGKGGWGEQLPLLAFGGGLLDQRGGIPLGEKNPVPLLLQPALDEADLGGFSGAIQPLDGDEPSGIVGCTGGKASGFWGGGSHP